MSCASPLPSSSPAGLLSLSSPSSNSPFLSKAQGSIFCSSPKIRAKTHRHSLPFGSERVSLTDFLANKHSPGALVKQEKLQVSPFLLDLRCKENRVKVDGVITPPQIISPLKRKRPAKLTIPENARLASMNNVVEFGSSMDFDEVCTHESSVFAVMSKKGRKGIMEDTHRVITSFQGRQEQAFFGVFDGHGGRKSADFAAEHLGIYIDNAIGDDDRSLETAIRSGYLAMDSAFLSKKVSSGACAVTAIIRERELVVGNAGDCSAVLSRNGKAEVLTNVHRASNLGERKRIESAGGFVDCFNGVWRVQGTLAVTRALGDLHLKQYISAEPEVRRLELTEDCEFLILASDGLWDKVTAQEAVDCARPFLSQAKSLEITRRVTKALRLHPCTPVGNLSNDEGLDFSKIAACKSLVSMASSRGNMDDITVMIVMLQMFQEV